MTTARVVIGANYGDEGKGLMVDYFCHHYKNSIVVRFNGGAQCGHTVVTPDSIRHKFGHFGSGSLAGAATYLSKYFVANPFLALKELNELKFIPKTYIHKDCFVSTPYDVLINQVLESSRSDKKHGSCGIGFNETIERCLNSEFKTTIEDILNGTFIEKLKQIQDEYIVPRLQKLNILDKINEIYFKQAIIDKETKDRILFQSKMETDKFIQKVQVVDDDNIINQFDNVVFEGGQGLLLDQNYGEFPHVTRSNTGIKNVIDIFKHIGFTRLEITYVTRCYITRHGVGPFPHETDNKPYSKIKDETNIHNKWQDDLRFGLIDIKSLRDRIFNDLRHINPIFIHSFNLAVTCLDQTDNRIIRFIQDEKEEKMKIEEFIVYLNEGFARSHGYFSFGPTRKNVYHFYNQLTPSIPNW